MNVARIVRLEVGLEKIAFDASALDGSNDPLVKQAAELIRALDRKIEDMVKAASVTETVTDLFNRGLLDDSEVQEKVAELFSSGNIAGETVKIASHMGSMFDGVSQSTPVKKEMHDFINEKLAR